jgi:hypothetical protein
MSAHITAAYVRLTLGTDVVGALAGTTALSQFIAQASALVDTGLVNAGYDIPATANDTVKLCTLGALLPLLHGAKGLQIPPDLKEHVVGMWTALASGTIQIPGMTPTARTAVGGVSWSDTSTTSTDGRPSIFTGRLRKVY